MSTDAGTDSAGVRPDDGGEPPIILLDGLRRRRRQDVVLCALGLSIEGVPSGLVTRTVACEDEQSWLAVIDDLRASGNRRPLLICCDGHPAVVKAVQATYPGVPVQISIAHRLLTLARQVQPRHRAACVAQAREIFRAPDKETAVARFRAWRECWAGREKDAVAHLEADLPHCLAFYRFPPHLWPKVRTVNLVERASRHVRPAGPPESRMAPAAAAGEAGRPSTDQPLPQSPPEGAGPSDGALCGPWPDRGSVEDLATRVLVEDIGRRPFAEGAMPIAVGADTPPEVRPHVLRAPSRMPPAQEPAVLLPQERPGPAPQVHAGHGYFVDLRSDAEFARWLERSRRKRTARWTIAAAMVVAAGFLVGLVVALHL